MTYQLLCAAICLATLAIAGAATAPLCAALETFIAKRSHWSIERRADMLFACRIAPGALAVAIPGFFVLPSMVELEIRGNTESVHWRLGFMAAVGLALCSVVALRAARVWLGSVLLRRAWMKRSIPMQLTDAASMRVYEMPNAGGLVATTGILRPRTFVSSEVKALLTPNELSAALAHEAAHIHAGDNLKRLLLRAFDMPFASSDTHKLWHAGAEIAADSSALGNGAPVADLASALVKVARLRYTVSYDPCAASCLVPAGDELTFNYRVRRLMALVDADEAPKPQISNADLVLIALASAALVISMQPQVLNLAHDLIEKLI